MEPAISVVLSNVGNADRLLTMQLSNIAGVSYVGSEPRVLAIRGIRLMVFHRVNSVGTRQTCVIANNFNRYDPFPRLLRRLRRSHRWIHAFWRAHRRPAPSG